MFSTGVEIITNSNSEQPGKSDHIPASVHFQNNDFINSYKGPSAKERISNAECFKRIFDAFTIEILAFLILFSMAFIQMTSISMILNKVCLVHYNYTREICSNLDNYTEIKSVIEKMATNYQLGYSLIQTVPAALLSYFIGPWSDMYGRKLPILIAIFGTSVSTLGSAICAYFMHSRVEYLFIPALFSGCFGGVITIMAVIYSYASDVTTEERRTVKFAFIEMAVGLGYPLGTASGGWTLDFLGYPSVFLLSASGFTISFMWVAFLLSETRGQNIEGNSKLKKLFTWKALEESFEATTKVRPNKGRGQILLLIIGMCFVVTATEGSFSITYLFVQHQYNWGQTKYSTLTAIYSIIGVVILAAVVPASKYFKLGDPILGVIGTASLILNNICFGFAWNPIFFHFGSILGCMSGCTSMAARSRISKLVSKDDLGKVFSFMASAETLFPVLMSVLISEIFNAFLDIYAAMPFIILAVCLILPFSVFIWIFLLSVKDSMYKYFENE